jgi:hypothetical protein
MADKLLSITISVNKAGNNNGYRGKPITEFITNGFLPVDLHWTVQYLLKTNLYNSISKNGTIF